MPQGVTDVAVRPPPGWSSKQRDVGGAAATVTRPGRLCSGFGASGSSGSVQPAAMVPPRHQQPSLLSDQLLSLLWLRSRYSRVREEGRELVVGGLVTPVPWRECPADP